MDGFTRQCTSLSNLKETMQQTTLNQFLNQIFNENSLIKATFSNPRKKLSEHPSRVSLRPIKLKEATLYQLTEHIQDKDFHRNITPSECISIILEKLIPYFKQALICTKTKDYHLLTNKKGETTILSKTPTKTLNELSHNRKKQYLLPDDVPLPFLIRLGIMNNEGKIFPKKMDKFRQINRFLEMVEDTLHALSTTMPLKVIDFGCGKAYLTFALHYFLKDIKGLNVQIVGLDLKKDVILHCQQIATELKLEGLTFAVGNITDYACTSPIDMVVALHACDTATDAAIYKAILWKAKVILAAPCCQHELYHQVASQSLDAILHYGILKERFAAIATDAARAQILEIQGYSTQILEFIDSEHTPKNLLIRATFGNTQEKREQALMRYQELVQQLSITPTLGTALSLT
jgi:SAM-dependent methyltransferase